MFHGGPNPIHPVVQPVIDKDDDDPDLPPSPEEDEAWRELVRCGGAGDRAETEDEQRERYKTAEENSVETNPGLAKHILRTPDIIVTCSLDYTIRTFDASCDFRPLQIFEGHYSFVNAVEPYHGNMLLSCSDDMTIRLWRLGAERYGELALTIWVNRYPVKCVCALPGQRAACGGLDKILRIVSLVTGATLHRIWDHGETGPDDAFFQKEGCGSLWCLLHLRGNLLASGSDDATIRVWDIDKGACLAVQIGHTGWGYDIGDIGRGYKLSETFAPVWRMIHLGKDGFQFASCSYDRTICIWDASDIANLHVVRKWKAAENSVLNMAMASEHHLVSCGADKEVKVWDFESGTCVRTVQTRGIAGAVAMIDHQTIAIGGGDATVRVYDWVEGKDLMGNRGFYAHEFSITWMARIFRDDGNPNKWIQSPIMYQTVDKVEGEKDATEALDVMRFCLKEALDFEDVS